MEFTEVEELEYMVRQSRLELQRQQASLMFTKENSYRSRSLRGLTSATTPFGPDATVARLFASSPPPDTFTISNDVVDVETSQGHKHPTFREANGQFTIKELTSSSLEKNSAVSKTDELSNNQYIVGINSENSPESQSLKKVQHSRDDFDFEYKAFQSEGSFETGYQHHESGLSKTIRHKKGSSGRSLTSPSLTHIIFLADLTSIMVEVALTATVDELIYAALERHIELSVYNDKEPTLLLNPKCYELRLHEANGVPDEDFPALDLTQKVKNFCELPNGGEFCLCEISDSSKLTNDATLLSRMSEYQALTPDKNKTNTSRRNKSGLEDHLDKLTNALQNSEDHNAAIQVTEGMKLYHIFDKIQKRIRLPLYSEQYQFLISEKDRNRLSLLSCVLDINTDLFNDIHSKGIRQLELRRRKFADTPMPIEHSRELVDPTKRRNYKRNPKVDEHTVIAYQKKQFMRRMSDERVHDAEYIDRPQPEKILFNDLTAAVYQEWDVIKTNKWSKRQKRIMGVDSQKIYNKPRKESGIRSLKRSERLISDVLAVEIVPNKPSCFRIKWRDAGESESFILEYEAEEGSMAAVEIVSKIKYIKSHPT